MLLVYCTNQKHAIFCNKVKNRNIIINEFFEREFVIKSDYNSKRAFLNTHPPLAAIHYFSRRMRGFCPPFGIRA